MTVTTLTVISITKIFPVVLPINDKTANAIHSHTKQNEDSHREFLFAQSFWLNF